MSGPLLFVVVCLFFLFIIVCLVPSYACSKLLSVCSYVAIIIDSSCFFVLTLQRYNHCACRSKYFHVFATKNIGQQTRFRTNSQKGLFSCPKRVEKWQKRSMAIHTDDHATEICIINKLSFVMPCWVTKQEKDFLLCV